MLGEWSDRANTKCHHSGGQTNRKTNIHHSILHSKQSQQIHKHHSNSNHLHLSDK